MDPPPILSSAFPLPPMGYIELFSDDNIRQNERILQPPPPIEVSFSFQNSTCNFYMLFRALMNCSVRMLVESIIQSRLYVR